MQTKYAINTEILSIINKPIVYALRQHIYPQPYIE